MEVEIIKKDDVSISYWSGGDSRQYFIDPPESSYASRDFNIRISLASSIIDEESKYTALDNYTRYLMMLEGNCLVKHKGHYEIMMHPYEEIDVFDGGWQSSGKGKMVDFNMMLAKGNEGEMSVIDKDRTIKPSTNWLALFCGLGKADIELSTGESYSLLNYDLIVFKNISDEVKLKIKLNNSKLIRMDISYGL